MSIARHSTGIHMQSPIERSYNVCDQNSNKMWKKYQVILINIRTYTPYGTGRHDWLTKDMDKLTKNFYVVGFRHYWTPVLNIFRLAMDASIIIVGSKIKRVSSVVTFYHLPVNYPLYFDWTLSVTVYIACKYNDISNHVAARRIYCYRCMFYWNWTKSIIHICICVC